MGTGKGCAQEKGEGGDRNGMLVSQVGLDEASVERARSEMEWRGMNRAERTGIDWNQMG